MSRELKAWQVGILTPPPSIIQLQINPVCAVFFFLTDKRSPKHFTDVNKELATVCVIYFMLKKISYFKLGLSLGPSETLKVFFFPFQTAINLANCLQIFTGRLKRVIPSSVKKSSSIHPNQKSNQPKQKKMSL